MFAVAVCLVDSIPSGVTGWNVGLVRVRGWEGVLSLNSGFDQPAELPQHHGAACEKVRP
jgi:hypothetical protein